MIAGRLIKKMNLADEARSALSSRLIVNVAPERETPGASAAACATPTANASP